jgi:hypothetical protein
MKYDNANVNAVGRDVEKLYNEMCIFFWKEKVYAWTYVMRGRKRKKCYARYVNEERRQCKKMVVSSDCGGIWRA